jgi:hypothetical protein
LAVTAAGQDGDRLVTPEMVTSVRWAADAHHVLDETIARIIAAVASDIAADVRRECADELQALMLSPNSWLTIDDCDSLSTVALDRLADRWSSSGRAPAGGEEQR